MDEGHVVIINHVLAHATAYTTGGSVAIFLIVQVTADVHACVIADAV